MAGNATRPSSIQSQSTPMAVDDTTSIHHTLSTAPPTRCLHTHTRPATHTHTCIAMPASHTHTHMRRRDTHTELHTYLCDDATDHRPLLHTHTQATHTHTHTCYGIAMVARCTSASRDMHHYYGTRHTTHMHMLHTHMHILHYTHAHAPFTLTPPYHAIPCRTCHARPHLCVPQTDGCIRQH